jgi:undecaprenyl-diphosphatase
MVNGFDRAVIWFFNGFVHRDPGLDQFVVEIQNNPLWKGAPLVAVLWWCWFREPEGDRPDRARVISTIAAALVGLILARFLAFTLPFRLRPLYEPGLGLQMPYGMTSTYLQHFSSFPSDHAVTFFALAAGIYPMSRLAGVAAFVHVTLGVCLPRLYLGLHYPTDLLGGAVLGVVTAWAAGAAKPRTYLARPALLWLRRAPGSFYVCLFLLSLELASMFDGARNFGRALVRLVSGLLI